MLSGDSDLKKMPWWDWPVQSVDELKAGKPQKCEVHNRSEFSFSYGAPGESCAK